MRGIFSFLVGLRTYQHPVYSTHVGRDSSNGIPICYGLDGRGIESRWGWDFPRPSRRTLRPTEGAFRGSNPPPPKFRRPSKIVPNSTRLWKMLKIAEFRTKTHQDVRKKGSKIRKLLLVRNCFTLAMTNKLVVFINGPKIPKIKKILLYEMKFLVPNYCCLQNPWLGVYRPQIPFLSILCPQLNLLNRPPPPNKIPGYPPGCRMFRLI